MLNGRQAGILNEKSHVRIAARASTETRLTGEVLYTREHVLMAALGVNRQAEARASLPSTL